MSALSIHHKPNQERSKNREEQRRSRTRTSDKSSKEARASHLTKQISIPSDKGKGSTQSIKNQNMTPQRQRQGSTQLCQKRKENQELNKTETPCISPSHVKLSLHVCTLKALCTSFWFSQKSNNSPHCSITKLLPLIGTCTHQGLDLKLPLKLRLPLNICYAMNAMQEV